MNSYAERTVGVVNTVAALIEHSPALTAGDRAALRRMDPRSPVAAFYKVEGLALDPHLPGDAKAREDEESRWATIVMGLAHLGALHQPDQRLGLALATAGFSEMRFARLLQADAEQLIDQLSSVARFLSAKSIAVDWAGAAQLILSAGRPGEENVRRHIARDYYGQIARETAGSS